MPPALIPPTIRTVPSARSVDVCLARAVIMSPVGVNVPGDCAVAIGVWPAAASANTLVIRHTCDLVIQRPSLNSDGYAGSCNPCGADLNGRRTVRRIGRKPKVHLVAV